jgi:hypothetical protein
MKIAAIDQGEVNGSVLEFLRGIQAGESASQDQDSVILCRHRQRSSLSILCTTLSHAVPSDDLRPRYNCLTLGLTSYAEQANLSNFHTD